MNYESLRRKWEHTISMGAVNLFSFRNADKIPAVERKAANEAYLDLGGTRSERYMIRSELLESWI